MNFVDAIKSGFSNYVGFSGRAARSEYWYWVLFAVIVAVVANVLDAILGLGLISLITGLALLLPGLAVAVRRLHDIDKSAWWILIILIPLVGFIILIVWACMQGTQGPNRFGPDPLGGVR